MSASIKWQKSSFSGDGGEACVELAHYDGLILMRESDNPTETITTTPAKLAAFLAGAKAGEFDHFTGSHPTAPSATR